MFLMRQFFLTIPREIEEAAIIDGANVIQIYWYIMLPLIQPVCWRSRCFVSRQLEQLSWAAALPDHAANYPLALAIRFFDSSLSHEAPAVAVHDGDERDDVAADAAASTSCAQKHFIEGHERRRREGLRTALSAEHMSAEWNNSYVLVATMILANVPRRHPAATP